MQRLVEIGKPVRRLSKRDYIAIVVELTAAEPILDRFPANAIIYFVASSGKFVGDGERQRAGSLRNRRYFRQVESNDLC